MRGGGSRSQDTGDCEGSVEVSQIPVTFFCDHSFSKSMASGEDCFPEEVRSVSQSTMNVEMTGCRYGVVVLPTCESLLLVTSSSFHLLPPQFDLDLLRCTGSFVVFPRSPLSCLYHLSPVQHSCGVVY